jgi:beta-glucosidase
LPFGQEALIDDISKVNKNIGVILISGNAVAMPWLKSVKAVLQSWYLGSEMGHAIADVVSGAVNPSGKLPFTFPVKLEDNAAISFGKMSYPGDGVDEYYKEGLLVGYRWNDTKKVKPLFPFGYGLSYTTFKLSNITCDKKKYLSNDEITVSCKLENTGGKTGAEVVQVYVGKPKSKVKRALKELKGFDKVFLNAGESSLVNIKIAVASLKYYDENQSDWHLEKGVYKIYVGNSSGNITKTLTVTIQ